jgi:transcriptional regulator with XRE-family HTH domain
VDEVRRLRLEKGWSQNELAYHAKLAPSVISLIETGKRDPNATTLRKLASALEVRIPDLFEDSGSGKAQRHSSFQASLLNGLEDERRIAALEHLPGIFRRCAEEWRKGLEHLEEQEPYWFWVVQAAANDFTDMLYRSDLLQKIRELPPEDLTPDFFEDLMEGGQKHGTADPELVAAVDLVDAFIEMDNAAEAVFEAVDAWEDAWLVNSQAEQRREQVRAMTRSIA